MQCDEISAGKKLIQLNLFNAQILRAFFRQERIKRNHLHLQAQAAFSNDRTDIAAANYTQHLAGDFNAHEAVLFPLAGMGRCVSGWQLAGQAEHHRNCVFCGGDGVAKWRVHNHNTACSCGWHINVINANAGTAYHAKLWGSCQNFLGHFGR